MTVAMMLPTALPVLAVLERMTAGRRDGRRLVALAAAGYLGDLGGFGLAAHARGCRRGRVVESQRLAGLQRLGIVAALLGSAGVYQFSAAEVALPRPLPLAGRGR